MKTRFFMRFAILLMVGLATSGCLFSSSFDAINRSTSIVLALTDNPSLEKPQTLVDLRILLQKQDENCQLPCFWGVRPGYTAEEEIVKFLKPVALGNNPPELLYTFAKSSDEPAIFSLRFGVKDALVSSIGVELDRPSEWLPSKTFELPYLLSAIPSIPDAYITIRPTLGLIFLTMMYKEGIWVEYMFVSVVEGNVISSDIDKPFLLCPHLSLTSNIRLKLFNPEQRTFLEEFKTSLDSERTWTIDRMAGMNTRDFIKYIIEEPDKCVELLSYPDLLNAGYEF